MQKQQQKKNLWGTIWMEKYKLYLERTHIFKHQMNRAPLEYIIDYRMEQAKRLFMTKKYNISEVSYMVGYDDMHYFSRLFKQKVGCSPTDFIKKQEGVL